MISERLFNIVLFAPEIPQNTGNIGRLCVNCDAALHLIRPLGFSLDASSVRRAGLDYWHDLDWTVYDSWDDFLGKAQPKQLVFMSTKGQRMLYDYVFEQEQYIVFGNEGHGLPDEFYQIYAQDLCSIPMPGKGCRSLNLANSVAITLYEAMRQVRHW